MTGKAETGELFAIANSVYRAFTVAARKRASAMMRPLRLAMRNVIVSYTVNKAACPQSETFRTDYISLVDIFTATATIVEKFSGWNIGHVPNMSEQ